MSASYQLKLPTPEGLVHQIPLVASLFPDVIALYRKQKEQEQLDAADHSQLSYLETQIRLIENRIDEAGGLANVLIVPITDYSLQVPKTACYALLGKCF